MKNYDESVEINDNPNRSYIPDYHYRILINDGSRSGKTNVLLRLIKHQRLERSLRLITNDENSSFKTLLQNSKDITVHQRNSNSQVLMTEIYKIVKGEAPAILKNFFIFWKSIHNIRNFQIINNHNKNAMRYGLETICYRTPYLWAILPEEYQYQNYVRKFKEKIKNWKYETCIC